MLREGTGLPLRMRPDDIEIHRTRNTPKCATVVLMGAATGMLFLGGVGLFRFLLLFGSLGALAALAVWAEPYRLQRLTGFLDPWQDPYGTGYQLTQALTGLGISNDNELIFVVSLSKVSFIPITVEYTTVDGTATCSRPARANCSSGREAHMKIFEGLRQGFP